MSLEPLSDMVVDVRSTEQLVKAVRAGNVSAASRILQRLKEGEELGANTAQVVYTLHHSLLMACRTGCSECIQLLLDANADVKATPFTRGDGLLHVAEAVLLVAEALDSRDLQPVARAQQAQAGIDGHHHVVLLLPAQSHHAHGASVSWAGER